MHAGVEGRPGIIRGSEPGPFPRVTSAIWGDEQRLRILHAIGNFVLLEVLPLMAKISHGYIVGEIGLSNFVPLLPDFILGHDDDAGSYLIGECRPTACPVPMVQAKSGCVQQS